MEEIELRYLVPSPALFAKLRHQTTLGPLSLRVLGQTRISDHYLDTCGHALQHQGWACRLRQEDGRWLVTLKAPSCSQDARITRTELEIALTKPSRDPADWPTGELGDKVINLTGGAPLVKLVTLRQLRQRALVIEDTRRIAELSLDRVDLCHAGVSQRTYILECELLPQGVQSDLDFIAAILVHHFCLLPDTRSKMLRALELTTRGYSPDYDPSVRYQPRTLDELLQRYDIDPAQATAVADTAERLFVELQPVHHLDSTLLPSLRVAAMLHDTGCSLGKTHHQRLGYAQLLLQPLADMPDDARLTAAASAYLHRGKINAKRLARAIPDSLQPASRERVLGLAALVRLATGLTSRRSMGASIVKVDINGQSVVIKLADAQSHNLHRRVRKKSDLWQQIYGRRLDWRYQIKEPLELALENHSGDELGILPQDYIQTAGAKIISVQLARMIVSAEAVRLAQDPEAVHDLRVACRRLRSAFRLIGPQLVGSSVVPCQEGLRACAQQLGAVRNYEVQLDLAMGYKNSAPSDQALQIEPLVNSWAAGHNQARQFLSAYIEGEEFARLISQLQELVNSQSRIPAPMKQRHLVYKMAPHYLRSAAQKVLAYDRVLSRASLEELHLLRIECKRLRYSLEFFNDLLAGDSTLVLARLIDAQTQLGTLHDWYVSLAALDSAFIHEQGSPERQGINNYHAFCYANMNQAYIRFLASWRAYVNPRIQHALQCLLNFK